MSIKGHLSWIGLDWGTSNLRAWGLDEAGEIVETARSNAGMGGLNPQEFEPALLDVIGEWLAPFHNTRQVPVICCGMVGARDGWAEAGYEKVPFKPGDMGEATSVPTLDKRLDVRILSGLSQHTPP
ncbi:MAG TPA: 2-keto-3-deoxy-galactonokinase, partial [Devosia sp.]|nr:2-keto-3-deoxy-galactonokinase [Devosia sp.]